MILKLHVWQCLKWVAKVHRLIYLISTSAICLYHWAPHTGISILSLFLNWFLKFLMNVDLLFLKLRTCIVWSPQFTLIIFYELFGLVKNLIKNVRKPVLVVIISGFDEAFTSYHFSLLHRHHIFWGHTWHFFFS